MTVFSQIDTYPTTKVINGDTVTLFHITQTKQIIKEGFELDYLRDKTRLDSLIILNQAKRIGSLKSQISLYSSSVVNLNEQLKAEKEINSINVEIINTYKRKVKLQKLKYGFTIGGISIVATIPLIFLIVK